MPDFECISLLKIVKLLVLWVPFLFSLSFTWSVCMSYWSVVFAQLLEPARYVWLLKALYGLLMLLPQVLFRLYFGLWCSTSCNWNANGQWSLDSLQKLHFTVQYFVLVFSKNFPFNNFIICNLLIWIQQSSAFKILKTRLKTVPSFSFSIDHYNFLALHQPQVGTNILEDGHRKQETAEKQELDFTSILQQFQSMQTKHRALAKHQRQPQKIPASPPKVSVLLHSQLLRLKTAIETSEWLISPL